MAPPESTLEVLEQCFVSLPDGFIPQPSPILNFFDFTWVRLPPVQRLFFFSYHHDKTHFINTTLPHIKHSLSLTLQHFHPLSGILTWPAEAIKPQIRTGENPGVMLTIAESDLDFETLVGNKAKHVDDFFPLVAKSASPKEGVEVEVPIVALKVTLFPNNGICIGVSSLHAVSDGKTIVHFIKSWASICKSELDDTSSLLPDSSLPSYDRSLIDIPHHLEISELKGLGTRNIFHQHSYALNNSKVRATIVLGRPDLQKLKKWVLDRVHEMSVNKDVTIPPPQRLSSFVLTLAYIWTCYIKVFVNDEEAVSDAETEILLFPVDCRERLNPPLPTTYFGNCLMPCFVHAKTKDLIGEDGIPIAAMAIGNAIEKFLTEGVLATAEKVHDNLMAMLMKGRHLSFAGSPKLGVYDADFGWGKPKKVEVISIDTTKGSMSLSEYPNGDGGLEIGLVFNKPEMDAFTSIYTNTLSSVFSSSCKP